MYVLNAFDTQNSGYISNESKARTLAYKHVENTKAPVLFFLLLFLPLPNGFPLVNVIVPFSFDSYSKK